MSKHTPGPWSFWSGYNPFDEVEAQITAEDGDIVIASYNNLIEEGEANARLMSAAPDLLEALEGLVEYIERMHHIGHIQRPQQSSVAYAAIAKVRGDIQ